MGRLRGGTPDASVLLAGTAAALGCNVRARAESSPFGNVFCDSPDDRVRCRGGAIQEFTCAWTHRQYRRVGPRQIHRELLRCCEALDRAPALGPVNGASTAQYCNRRL